MSPDAILRAAYRGGLSLEIVGRAAVAGREAARRGATTPAPSPLPLLSAGLDEQPDSHDPQT